MATKWIILAVIISFAVTSLLGKKLIPYLHKLKFGQIILEIGPAWHKNKQGTPTMGGIMFIIGIFAAVVVCLPLYYHETKLIFMDYIETPTVILKLIAGLVMALSFGGIGFLDDYIKVVKKQNLGLNAKQKLLLQFAVAISYLMVVYVSESSYGASYIGSMVIPFFGRVLLPGVIYWPCSAILIVGMVNAVNLTDGIDGLDTSLTFFYGAFALIISGILDYAGLGIVSGALMGGCLGFLLWNRYPAMIFMGDTGSLFLGGIICAIAYTLDMPILIITMGLVYILEMFSVILQVMYFKLTGGKRLFKMSPLHHHFEMCSWSETKICISFCLVMIICGVISVWSILSGL
ncbi:MAG: phospho-N-acetylmuramoyl-pentapeptide-transferase [Clostridia bacterium]|nr:phospho-N-acetylmuramoyl-pentapeptide-transferase [Clostridia bacterium]